MAILPQMLLLLLLLFSAAEIQSNGEENFDVRRHLSTVTSVKFDWFAYFCADIYHVAKDISENSFVPSSIPDQCKPIHLNLVARHGTRAPTKKRMKELEALAPRLEILENIEEQQLSVQKIPAWLWGWKSPWTGMHKDGELISEGENELYQLGIRTGEKFPELSAVAFGTGLFSGQGNLRPGRIRAFVVTTESPASDIMLRFHDCCQNYKEASLLNTIDQACALFSEAEVGLLEWTDDLEEFILKCYGNSLNYRMGVQLLEDVVQSMEQAIKANEDGLVPGSYEMARLRFAHGETLLPFSCLIGLFLEGSGDFEQIQREQPLQLPPKQRRIWRGSTVAPFAGNNMLSKYFVQVLHNEHPIPLPGCENSDFCSFVVFKERIAAPHLKQNYNDLCWVKSEPPVQKASTSKLSQILSWLFLADARQPQKDELYFFEIE
ncbi:hypothetical protein Pfo_027581 [Paulownia fortunei]|nr:hypothetical protein Pfo_027581 [Paulownia fortunei]